MSGAVEQPSIPTEAISDAALVDLYWSVSSDDWAIPEMLMVKFGRAVEAEVREQIARDIEPHPDATSPYWQSRRDLARELRQIARAGKDEQS